MSGILNKIPEDSMFMKFVSAAMGAKSGDAAIKLTLGGRSVRVSHSPNLQSTDAHAREAFRASIHAALDGTMDAQAVDGLLDKLVEPDFPLTARTIMKVMSAIEIGVTADNDAEHVQEVLDAPEFAHRAAQDPATANVVRQEVLKTLNAQGPGGFLHSSDGVRLLVRDAFVAHTPKGAAFPADRADEIGTCLAVNTLPRLAGGNVDVAATLLCVFRQLNPFHGAPSALLTPAERALAGSDRAEFVKSVVQSYAKRHPTFAAAVLLMGDAELGQIVDELSRGALQGANMDGPQTFRDAAEALLALREQMTVRDDNGLRMGMNADFLLGALAEKGAQATVTAFRVGRSDAWAATTFDRVRQAADGTWQTRGAKIADLVDARLPRAQREEALAELKKELAAAQEKAARAACGEDELVRLREVFRGLGEGAEAFAVPHGYCLASVVEGNAKTADWFQARPGQFAEAAGRDCRALLDTLADLTTRGTWSPEAKAGFRQSIFTSAGTGTTLTPEVLRRAYATSVKMDAVLPLFVAIERQDNVSADAVHNALLQAVRAAMADLGANGDLADLFEAEQNLQVAVHFFLGRHPELVRAIAMLPPDVAKTAAGMCQRAVKELERRIMDNPQEAVVANRSKHEMVMAESLLLAVQDFGNRELRASFHRVWTKEDGSGFAPDGRELAPFRLGAARSHSPAARLNFLRDFVERNAIPADDLKALRAALEETVGKKPAAPAVPGQLHRPAFRMTEGPDALALRELNEILDLVDEALEHR